MAEPIEEAVAAPEAAPEEVQGDLFDSPETDQFPREYVEKLRNEAAKYRTKAKDFEVFDRYEEDQRKGWTELAAAMLEDPSQGAKTMKEIAEQILSEYADSGEDAPSPEDAREEASEFLNKADLDRYMQEYQDKQEQERLVSSIESEAKTLGYEPGTEDYVSLMWLNANKTGGDLKAAHELKKQAKQAAIDEYLASKAAEADGTPAAAAGAIPSQENGPPTDLQGSKAAMMARLKSQFG